jgi:hypothetical protein
MMKDFDRMALLLLLLGEHLRKAELVDQLCSSLQQQIHLRMRMCVAEDFARLSEKAAAAGVMRKVKRWGYRKQTEVYRTVSEVFQSHLMVERCAVGWGAC